MDKTDSSTLSPLSRVYQLLIELAERGEQSEEEQNKEVGLDDVLETTETGPASGEAKQPV